MKFKDLEKRLAELRKDLELASGCQEIAYFENEIAQIEAYIKQVKETGTL